MTGKINDMLAVKLEQKAIIIESIFPGTYYAVDRNGKGMWLLINGKEIPICADQVEAFISEFKEVWKTFRRNRRNTNG